MNTDLIDNVDPNDSSAPALSRGLYILEILGENPGGCTFSELIRFGIPRSSLHRILKTLIDARYVTLSPSTKRYHLGIKLFALGHAVYDAMPVINLSRSLLADLREESQETSEIWIPDGLALVLALTEQAPDRFSLPQQATVGVRDFRNHSKAPGKAYLAFAGDDLVQSYLDRFGLPSWGPNTITDKERLLAELQHIREQGYAIDREENRVGLCRIAAPIRDGEGQPAAFLSIVGPAFRMTPEKDSWYAQMVCRYAERISLQLGWNASRMAGV